MLAVSRRPVARLLLAALLLTAACGGSSVPPPERPSQEEPTPEAPLATLQGQLQLAPEATVSGPVRLALAWYPGLLSDASGALSRPQGIVTEEVASSGSFPMDYTFDVQAPPPEAALVQLGEGLQGRGAVGILLAYRDLNGNAALDTIPATGSPVDQVVGASLLWAQPPAYLVLYLDAEQDAATGLKKGFNLVRLVDNLTSEVVPLTTSIPLSLHEDPLLDVFVCEAAWDDTAGQAPCGILEEDPVEGPLTLAGSLTFTDGAADVALVVGRDGEPEADAQVTVAGHTATFDASLGQYTLHLDDASALLAQGLVAVSAREGDEVVADTLQVPADFQVNFPAPQLRIRPGGAVTVAWNESPGAQEYQVSVVAGEQELASAVTPRALVKLTPEAYVGEAVVRVAVVATPQDGASLQVRLVHERPITFAPCDTVTEGSGLTVEGEFRHLADGHPSWQYNEVRVEVKDGGQGVPDATVQVNGLDVPYWPQAGAYENTLLAHRDFGLGETVELRASRGGEEVCRVLTLPGAFALTLQEEPSQAGGTSLAIAWTRALGAVQYEYVLGGGSEQPFYSGSTNELSTTIEGVDYVGSLGLSVAAVGVAPLSDTLGWVDVKRVQHARVTLGD